MYDLYKLIIVNQFDNNNDEILPKLPRSFCILFQVKKQGYFLKEGQSTKKLLIWVVVAWTILIKKDFLTVFVEEYNHDGNTIIIQVLR